jgi:hypothetical protein
MNQTFSNTGGLAFARATDPNTSHNATNAASKTLEKRMEYIVELVQAAPDCSIADHVDEAMRQTGYGSWLYGSIGTCFHHCIEAGLIRVSGTKRHPESKQLQQVYQAFPKEARDMNLAHWLMAKDEIARSKKDARAAKKRRALEDKKQKEYDDEHWNPCHRDGTPW